MPPRRDAFASPSPSAPVETLADRCHSPCMSAAAFLVAVGLLATSPGVLGTDAREQILYRAGSGTPAPAMRGTFIDAARGLYLRTPARFADNVALWTSTTMADGLVRARFVVGSSLHSAVVVRGNADALASTAANGAVVDSLDEFDGGYSFAFEKGVLRVHRHEHRMARLLGVEDKLTPAPRAGSVVELVVLAVGPWLSATAYDGATLQKLAHVEVVDRGFTSGHVGVRVYRAQDEASALQLLTVAKAATAALLPSDLTMDGEGTGAGAERVLSIAANDVPRLPSWLRRTAILEGDVAVLVTDMVGVQQVQRAGVALLKHKTQLPFKYRDAVLRAHLGTAPSSTSRGPRIDESYKDAAMVEALLIAWAARYPQLTRLEELGRSREGRPILALLISRNAAVDEVEPAVLFDGAHHGGELISTEIVLDAMQQLLEGYGTNVELTRFVDTLAVWCVPLVNVDGNHRYVHETRDYDRKNARDIDDNGRLDGSDGVDLYRQYPVRWGGLGEVGSRSWPYHYRYRGPSAASEPEIVAMMQLAERERFAASIDFHTAATKILVPYTDPSMSNPVDNEAWTIAEAIGKTLPMQPSRRRYDVVRNLYPVDGTAQDWLRFAFGTVALLVEAPQHNPLPWPTARTANVVGTRGTWVGLLRAVSDGPSVRVRVVDVDGAPVEAAVTVLEQAPQQGERWTSRPRDGLAVRLRGQPGRATIIVDREGSPTVKRVVEVGDRPLLIDVQL